MEGTQRKPLKKKQRENLFLYQTNGPEAMRISEEDRAAQDEFTHHLLHEDIFKK